jgi:hypothetical protein
MTQKESSKVKTDKIVNKSDFTLTDILALWAEC